MLEHLQLLDLLVLHHAGSLEKNTQEIKQKCEADSASGTRLITHVYTSRVRNRTRTEPETKPSRKI